MLHKTIYRINDPAGGDGYVTLHEVDGVSYPVTSDTRLSINGKEWAVVRSQVEITDNGRTLDSIQIGMVVTTITVVPNYHYQT